MVQKEYDKHLLEAAYDEEESANSPVPWLYFQDSQDL